MLKTKKKFKNLFKNLDSSFCVSETCSVKDICVRHSQHYKFNSQWISCVREEDKCNLFVEGRYE